MEQLLAKKRTFAVVEPGDEAAEGKAEIVDLMAALKKSLALGAGKAKAKAPRRSKAA